MNAFKDRIVWITGASSGIGEALAVAFRGAGARLILSARREDELKRVQGRCGGEPDTRVLPLDMSLTETLADKAKTAQGLFGLIDILVLNAGISQRSLTRATDESVYRRLMEVNFFGPEALTRAVLPAMLERKSGHMVVTSSIAGKFGVPLRSGYSASKFALYGFYEALRAEESRNGIRVTMVCPGFIRTEISVSALKGAGSKHAKMDPELARGHFSASRELADRRSSATPPVWSSTQDTRWRRLSWRQQELRRSTYLFPVGQARGRAKGSPARWTAIGFTSLAGTRR